MGHEGEGSAGAATDSRKRRGGDKRSSRRNSRRNRSKWECIDEE